MNRPLNTQYVATISGSDCISNNSHNCEWRDLETTALTDAGQINTIVPVGDESALICGAIEVINGILKVVVVEASHFFDILR